LLTAAVLALGGVDDEVAVIDACSAGEVTDVTIVVLATRTPSRESRTTGH
jgi:hypothetical protein